jgi:hypothetical protein
LIRPALRLPLATIGVGALLVSSVALPLAIYTTVLALFGVPHIGSELRYLDYRFGIRLGRSLVYRLVGLLGLAMAARAAGVFGLLSWPVAAAVEITLAAVAILAMANAAREVRWSAMLAALLLVICAILAPLATLLFLAVSHNLTPLGFLAERLQGAERRRALLLGGLGFIGLPLLIATGLPFHWLGALGLDGPEVAAFPAAGSLEANFGAYLPGWAFGENWALHAFSACVFAQCIHYIAVIIILPRLIPADARPIAAWPSGPWFWLVLAAIGFAAFTGFAVDYAVVRQVYGVLALFHAWLEIPLLLFMLAPRPRHQATA